MMENKFNESVVIVLILASDLDRLDKATSAFLERYPNAVAQPPLPNTRPPHESGFRRYINVVVNGEEGNE